MNRSRTLIPLLGVALFIGLSWWSSTKEPSTDPTAPSRLDTESLGPEALRFSGMTLSGPLDPAEATTIQQVAALYRVAEGLVRLNPSTLALEPALAESWEVSEDARLWTFHLKSGVLFHDGSSFSSKDVVASFHHVLRPPAGKAPMAWVLEDIEGAEEFRQGLHTTLPGLSAPNPQTVHIRLSIPSAVFPMKLTTAGGLILSAASLQELGEEPVRRPIGTGPFEVQAIIAGETLLTANTSYRDGAPAIKSLALIRHLPAEQTLELFGSGDLDLVADPPGTRQQLESLFPKRFKVWPAVGLLYLAINHQSGPLSQSLPLRQAVVHAIDRKRLAGIGTGLATAASGILPLTIPGADPETDWYPHDPQRARALLAEAGYPNGDGLPPLRLAQGTLSNEMLQQIQQDLQAVGLQVHQVPAEFLDIEQFDLMGHGWWADYPEPSTYLQILLASSRAGQHANWGHYQDPTYDALLSSAMVTLPEPLRLERYQRAEHRALQQVALIPLLYELEALLAQPRWSDSLILSPLGRFYIPVEKLRP